MRLLFITNCIFAPIETRILMTNIAIVVLLLFGGKKIPELMKGIGKGVKNFKDGVKGLEDDIKLDDTEKK